MNALHPVPEFVRVWWATNRPGNMAKVLSSRPYTGKFTEMFTHVMVVEAPNTKKRELELCYDARTGN